MIRKIKRGLLLISFAGVLSLYGTSSLLAQEAVLSDTLRHYILSGWVIQYFSSSGSGYAFVLRKGLRLKLCNVGTTTECYTLNF